jgi:hypothetical protein
MVVVRRLLLGLVILLAGIQLIRPARTNPAVDPSKTINAKMAIDPGVAGILQRSCQDCHSNLTVWPWYSQVAPSSWLVAHDVNEARSKMNLSEWAVYDPDEAHTLLEHMCREVTMDRMPPHDYTTMHAGTALHPEDVKAICDWTGKATNSSSAAQISGGK